MKRLAITLVLCGGCVFEVSPVDVSFGALDGGGSDLAPDLHVVLDLAGDAGGGGGDFTVAADLTRFIPDGAIPGQPGYPCNGNNDCQNALCVDGYCCDSACDATDPANNCHACNVPGSEGHCVNALDGTDPRDQCSQDPQSSCGQDGWCDGLGNCRLWSAGSLCGDAVCAGGQVTGPPSCDGNGACVPSRDTADCAPYVCAADGMSCGTSCMDSNDCESPAICTSGSCGKKGVGTTCGDPSECDSGFCSQGVCCATDCSGVCSSCNQPGAAGICVFAAAGTDPLNQCTGSSPFGCGLDGQCDGKGACRYWSTSTQCAFPMCMGDSSVPSRHCDGAGRCAAAAAMSCGNYTCNAFAGTCYTAPCFGNYACSGKNKCTRGTCQ
jgi:hypothetical protein